MDAGELLSEIGSELAKVEGEIRDHPYVKTVEEGRVKAERLRVFVGEQLHIIGSDLRGMAHLVSRYGQDPERQFFVGSLEGEVTALEALYHLAEALEIEPDELMEYEPSPGAQAYPAYMAWLAHYGDAAQVAAAFAVNFPVWGEVCGRLSSALRSGYGLQEGDVAFFDLFASPPQDFMPGALELVQRGLDRGVDPRSIRRAARLLQAYELMFWDAVHATSLRGTLE
jgi:thiaminase